MQQFEPILEVSRYCAHRSTRFLTDIEVTMKVGRSVLSRYYSLDESQDGSVFKELENWIFTVLECFLAPIQSIAQEFVHATVYYEMFVAGKYYKYADHLSEMKTLQDAYKD